MSALRISMSSKVSFQVAKTKDDYTLALPLVSILNPLLSKEAYWQYTAEMRDAGNYKLYLAYNDNVLIGICGCWIATKYYTGKYLEIDNFIISPAFQGKGFGSEFLKFIDQLALENNCNIIMLDAYLENEKAHRFYKQHGFVPKGYHFLKEIRNH